jgi:hypothetical protein
MLDSIDVNDSWLGILSGKAEGIDAFDSHNSDTTKGPKKVRLYHG